jgi:hypothetical protein
MSADYSIELATQNDPDKVIEILFKDIEVEVANHDKGIWIKGEDFRGIIIPKDSNDARSQTLGVTPNMVVSVSVTSVTLDGHLNILKAALNWLTQTTEDMVLLFNYESVLLVREAGEVIRNSNPGLWTNEMLNLITIPHKVLYIPVL